MFEIASRISSLVRVGMGSLLLSGSGRYVGLVGWVAGSSVTASSVAGSAVTASSVRRRLVGAASAASVGRGRVVAASVVARRRPSVGGPSVGLSAAGRQRPVLGGRCVGGGFRRAVGSGCGRLTGRHAAAVVDQGLEPVGEVAGQGLEQAGELARAGPGRRRPGGPAAPRGAAGRPGPRHRPRSSTLVPSSPPLTTRVGLVRAKSRRVLATAAASPWTNVMAVGPVSSSSSPSSAGLAGGEAHQGVLVDLVLAAGGAQLAAEVGEGRRRSGPRYSVSSAASARSKRSCTSSTTATFSGLGFSIDTSFRMQQGRSHARHERPLDFERSSPRLAARRPLPVRTRGLRRAGSGCGEPGQVSGRARHRPAGGQRPSARGCGVRR